MTPASATTRAWLRWTAWTLLVAAPVAWLLSRRVGPTPQPVAAPPNVRDADPPDPRLTFSTPFRNVRPEVRYVGDAACAKCHAAIASSYHGHPMGMSAAFVDKGPAAERLPDGPPSAAQGFLLSAKREDGRIVHRVAAAPKLEIPDFRTRADVAVGSGVRGRSYLHVDGERVWQTPISWFTRDGKWDVSPGFRLGSGEQRPIVDRCLFCHVDRVEPLRETKNGYRQPTFGAQIAIGCERCHGPGELHVAERETPKRFGAVDDTIVNPKRLDAELRMAICRQCHLQGEAAVVRRGRDLFEFRPGLPLDAFLTVFVRHPHFSDRQRSVGQFEQMQASVCFAKSDGKMDCTSCHDPHAKPASAARAFAARCMHCHATKGCAAPAAERNAQGDSCIACHMPRNESSTIAHASVTDHRILRKPAPNALEKLPPGDLPIVPFPAAGHAPNAEEMERDWGIALGELTVQLPEHAVLRQSIAFAAAKRLKAALQRWPGDAPAWQSLATVQSALGQTEAALDSATRAADLAPDSEAGLSILIDVALDASRGDLALKAADRLVAANPTWVGGRLKRVEVRLRRKDWSEAEADCRKALEANPLHAHLRACLAVCRHRQGDVAEAEKQIAIVRSLAEAPETRLALSAWYERQIRP